MLANLRAAFSAQRVTAENLPAVLKREWSAPDGRARVQVYPSGDVNDPANLKRFSAAVLAIAPEATGTPISTEASGRTIVDAFLQAGLYSFLAIVLMLGAFLRQPKHMALALLPLVMTELLILGTCVALGIALNFANIIVLPLSLGIGIAFNIYFLMAWLRGHGQFLRSSLARAVILSALTTASGFGTLWLSRHPGTASLGELLMISLAWTLAVTLFFVPALLYSVTPDSVTPDNSASVTSRSSVDRRAH